jgi:hypothetical protein
MTAFAAGLHVTGRADPARVVAHLTGAGVSGATPKPARRAWASIALARWLAHRNRAALAAYQEQK